MKAFTQLSNRPTLFVRWLNLTVPSILMPLRQIGLHAQDDACP